MLQAKAELSKTNKNNENGNITTTTNYNALPFIPSLTNKQNIKNIFDKNINIAFKPNQTINTLFSKQKPKTKIHQQNNVVYEIKCAAENCKKIYIGQTKRSLETRINEHKRTIEQKKSSTALSQHMLENNHTADFESVKVLEREKRLSKRLMLESLHIKKKQKQTINKKEDCDNVSCLYTPILTELHQKSTK